MDASHVSSNDERTIELKIEDPLFAMHIWPAHAEHLSTNLGQSFFGMFQRTWMRNRGQLRCLQVGYTPYGLILKELSSNIKAERLPANVEL